MSITSDGIKLHHKRKGYCCAFLFGAVELILSALLVVSLGAHILFPEQARGATGVATTLSYQGRLTDTSGNPLGGAGTNYCFSFSVFDASSGGNKLWPAGATTTSTLLVTNGVFNASVGPVDAFDFSSNNTTYLHVDVYTVPTTCTGGNWEALAPRQQLNAVAYARVAAEVYGPTLQTSSSTNSVIIGPAGGDAGNPTLVYLGKKTSSGSSFTTVGQSCAGYDGTIWYNSATTRALVCEANVVRAISNATTTIDAVMPAGNLDVAATAITNGTLTLAGGNNITLSQAGNAITVRGAYNPAQFTNSTANATMNLLWAGNSNGSGNITMGLTGSTITASAPSGGGGAAIAASGIATTFTSGTVVFSGGNLMSISTGAGQAVIVSNLLSSATTVSAVGTANAVGAMASRFALEGHQHAGVPVAGISGGNTSNTSGTYYGSLMFAGGNNITLSAVTGAGGQTVTIVGAAGGGGAAFSAGTQSVNTGTVNFANSNNISFGMSNSNQITASAAFGGIADSAASTVTNGIVQFNNLNGVSFGLNGNTMTASVNAGGGVTISTFEPFPFQGTGTGAISLSTATSAAQMMFPFIVPQYVAAEYIAVPVSMSYISTSINASYTGSLQWGVFTRPTGLNSTRLSLYGNASGLFSYAGSNNTSTQSFSHPTSTNNNGYVYGLTNSNGLNITSGYTGLKQLMLYLNTTLNPGQYWFGLHHRFTTAGAAIGIRMSLYGNSITLSNLAPMGSFSTAYSTGTKIPLNQGGNWGMGNASYTVAGLTQLTTDVTMSQMTQNLTIRPYMKFATRL